jgi:hypothetical protein
MAVWRRSSCAGEHHAIPARAERLTARLGQDRRDTSAADAAGAIAESDRLRSALATLSAGPVRLARSVRRHDEPSARHDRPGAVDHGSGQSRATFRVTSVGGSGTATMLLAQAAPSGAVEKTFATYTRSYSGFPQEGAVTTPCRVIATDATGKYTLATCPGFVRIANGTLTPLAASSGRLHRGVVTSGHLNPRHPRARHQPVPGTPSPRARACTIKPPTMLRGSAAWLAGRCVVVIRCRRTGFRRVRFRIVRGGCRRWRLWPAGRAGGCRRRLRGWPGW